MFDLSTYFIVFSPLFSPVSSVSLVNLITLIKGSQIYFRRQIKNKNFGLLSAILIFLSTLCNWCHFFCLSHVPNVFIVVFLLSFRWLACCKLFCASAQLPFFPNSCVFLHVTIWNSLTSENWTLWKFFPTLENTKEPSCHRGFPHSMFQAICSDAQIFMTTEISHLGACPTRPHNSTAKKVQLI